MASRPSTVNDPATASAADTDILMTTAQDPSPARAEPAQPQKQAPRVRAVHARNLDTISGAEELMASVACAIDAHREIYEHGTAKELHGDINPNSILIFDHPPRPAPNSTHGSAEGSDKEGETKGDDAPWDSPYGPSAGAMVYWEPPISLATLRLVGNPDKPQPPPAWKSARYQYVMPPWDAG
ncbi:uncharacterized protein TRAVEDRAFT_53912 [Trametes versicolor FP-101664 SS1]|uniref:Fungal-type protein kinase domain-containing protein n=1 Tax=Trametes versicolor (strain FP-101664) TaxID=717944 RepID=R7S8C7_TRAVS|nr:uncharacterized protein TRAVEDRAFT_53912 [Trametes versicolor FP-101664 SS1]EIW51917.1 hypothetical protein TRAVEDRAFT_53912 [Trametes versicolor FP-101664 SS1]